MATYKVQELLKRLQEIQNDGYNYVDIMEFSDDSDDEPYTALSFDALADEFSNIDYESIHSCIVDEDNYICDSRNASSLRFNSEELSTIYHAIKQADEYYRANINTCKKEASECQKLKVKISRFLHENR